MGRFGSSCYLATIDWSWLALHFSGPNSLLASPLFTLFCTIITPHLSSLLSLFLLTWKRNISLYPWLYQSKKKKSSLKGQLHMCMLPPWRLDTFKIAFPFQNDGDLLCFLPRQHIPQYHLPLHIEIHQGSMEFAKVSPSPFPLGYTIPLWFRITVFKTRREILTESIIHLNWSQVSKLLQLKN